ncbi:YpmS family protein [Bacillus sp. V5-8f]|uniref:YpmS family protein n=1 Tax=Bacillus sp. V5-8f TaxID=2053044 RepID=UPI0021556E93|nr:YpmS family protein [Bacillus sp. V5-8f]
MERHMKWKNLFFSLLALNLMAFFIVLFFAFQPVKDDKITPGYSSSEDIQFTVDTNKKDLNRLINRYLDKEGFSGLIHYEVFLHDDVQLFGTLPVFGKNLELQMAFEPIALENGDLELRQKSISVGQMNLPVSYVLRFVKERYKIPDWVSIRPGDELIYVSLQNMKLKSDIRIKAKTFNLNEDDISFLLTVPSQK